MASLVVQTSFLGDVILTTPLIAELARRAPVDVVTTPEGAAVLANNPAIRTVIAYDKRRSDRGVRGFARIVTRVRNAGSFGRHAGTVAGGGGEYETAYLAQGSVRSAALAVAARIRNRIGFHTSAGRAFYTVRVEYQPDRHHAERLWWLSMSQCADMPLAAQITPRLYPGTDDIEAVDALLGACGIGGQTRFVAIAPGSAWDTKRWPFYPELAIRLADEFRVVVVVGGSGDAGLGAAIVAQLQPGRGINAAGRLGILASAELIRRAAALVTNDSAPQHLASAVNTPTLAIYGPTVASFGFGPLAARSATVGHNSLACRPCHTHGPQRCPLGHWRCMRELSSGHVFDLLARTLS